jgi:DNA-binding phage protein
MRRGRPSYREALAAAMKDPEFAALYQSEKELIGNEPGSLAKMMRLQAGLTQSEVASRAGMQSTWICKTESGETNPTYRTLCAIARACGYCLEIRVAKEA